MTVFPIAPVRPPVTVVAPVVPVAPAAGVPVLFIHFQRLAVTVVALMLMTAMVAAFVCESGRQAACHEYHAGRDSQKE